MVKNNTLVVLDIFDKFLGCGHGTSDTYFRVAANAAKSYGLFLQWLDNDSFFIESGMNSYISKLIIVKFIQNHTRAGTP